jgi:RHS repeat-associated protein
MKRTRHSPEQIIVKLREADALLENPNLASNFADCDVYGDGVIGYADIDPFVVCLTNSGRGAVGGGPPRPGTFVLHGRPVDVLPDGHVLMNFRARYYDVKHGRWLQRDRSGYADGGNLYEAFRSNATRFQDPLGQQSWVDDLIAFGRNYLSPEAIGRQAVDRAAGVPPSDPAEQAIALTADAAHRAEPYVRPVVQTMGVVGGGAQMVVGVVIIAGSEGLGAPIGYVLVARGEDVTLTNIHGLYTGTMEPTALWLVTARIAGPRIATAGEMAVDLALLPVSLEAVPIRGPTPVLSTMSTFEGFQAVPRTGLAVTAQASWLDRLAAGSRRTLAFVVGEDDGYVLGTRISPGELGPLPRFSQGR